MLQDHDIGKALRDHAMRGAACAIMIAGSPWRSTRLSSRGGHPRPGAIWIASYPGRA